MPLLSSAVIGLARRPLDASDAQEARSLSPTADSPAKQALALAAKQSLLVRSSLATSLVAPQTQPIVAPQGVTYGLLDQHIATWLEVTAALLRRPNARYLFSQDLSVPNASLLEFCTQTLGRQQVVRAEDLIALDVRGRWLAGLHPRLKSKVSFLDQASVPKNASHQVPYLRYFLSQLVPKPTSDAKEEAIKKVTAAINQSKLITADQKLLLMALSQNPTAVAELSEEVVQSVLTDERLSSVVRGKVTKSIGGPAWSKLEAELASRLTEAKASDSYNLDTFGSAAEASVILADTHTAQRLLEHAIKSDDLLLRQHPLLAMLIRTLLKPAYGEVLDLTVTSYSEGWRSKVVTRLIAASAQPFSQTTSEELLHDAVRSYAPMGESRAATHLDRLHPATITLAEELAHERSMDAELQLLVSGLRARQRLGS